MKGRPSFFHFQTSSLFGLPNGHSTSDGALYVRRGPSPRRLRVLRLHRLSPPSRPRHPRRPHPGIAALHHQGLHSGHWFLRFRDWFKDPYSRPIVLSLGLSSLADCSGWSTGQVYYDSAFGGPTGHGLGEGVHDQDAEKERLVWGRFYQQVLWWSYVAGTGQARCHSQFPVVESFYWFSVLCLYFYFLLILLELKLLMWKFKMNIRKIVTKHWFKSLKSTVLMS